MLEIVIVFAFLAVLGAGLVGFVNPGVRFAKLRNDERRVHVNLLLSAVSENMFDNKGVFLCEAGSFPSSSTMISSDVSGYDLLPCVFPRHLAKVVFDPNNPSAFYTSTSSYNLGYAVLQDAVTGRIILEAPFAELGEDVSAFR